MKINSKGRESTGEFILIYPQIKLVFNLNELANELIICTNSVGCNAVQRNIHTNREERILCRTCVQCAIIAPSASISIGEFQILENRLRAVIVGPKKTILNFNPI